MISEQVQIVNRLGLHARAAANFVKLASSYESEIYLVNGEQSVNGKSIMGIMMLAASLGTELKLEVSGPDEKVAITSLAVLINNRFGEDE